MRKFLREHSLSLVLAATALGWFVILVFQSGGFSKIDWGDLLSNAVGDTYGGWVVVVMSEWFREKGSSQSK